jgi:wobble nucleotide-excising tRNase
VLERIELIQGIGLLHDAQGKKHTLQKATLIYADNGRGKSTLASVFRSLSLNDSSLIDERTTIDGTISPRVILQFGSGHKVTFDKGAWSEQRPELVVFDADFIEKNVYSGGIVNTNHRKNLLEFALGEQAVLARQLVDRETEAAKGVSAKVNDLTSKLSGRHAGMTLAAFEKLPKAEDTSAQIEALQKRITATKNIEALQKRALPLVIDEPALNFDALFSILSSTLESVHDDAERIVSQHIAKLGGKDAEHWLSQGQAFANDEACPYCNQSLQGIDLVKAYRTHFNANYRDNQKKIAQLHDGIAARTSQEIVNQFALKVETANAVIETWQNEIELAPISFSVSKSSAALSELHSLLSTLADVKRLAPTEAAGTTEDRARAEGLWQTALQEMQQANASIREYRKAIEEFKLKLKAEDITQLSAQIKNLELAEVRHAPDVVDLISQYKVEKQNLTEAEGRKKLAREKLDTLMVDTLKKYESTINKLLLNFGAAFSIQKMDANFRGGSPRSEYSLLLRNKSVNLEGGKPTFGTALSEGDKRTLAFAFFIASVLSDDKLSQKIIAIDDPMCSLDVNRKRHTRTVLKEIYTKAEQLILLCHDLYFIRDMRNDLTEDGKPDPISIQLAYAGSGYSDFAGIDIDRECESTYYRHHRMLVELIEGSPCSDLRSVAKAIRPLLEGYLHRRFPGFLPEGQMFGQVVGIIRDASVPSPLAHAHNLVSELNDINGYAGQFHHDTNPGNADAIQVVTTELVAYAKRALHIVHGSAPMTP